MRHRHHVTVRNRTDFETNRLGGGCTGCTITGNTKLEDELTPKGGVMLRFWHSSGIPCHVVTCTSAASIGGVERQNPSIRTNQSFVNNLFFP